LLTTVRVTYWTEPGHPVDRLKELFGAASIWYGRDWCIALRRLRGLMESDQAPARRSGPADASGYSTPVHQ